MIDPLTMRRLRYRALFLCIAGFVLFLRLLPVSPGSSGWPGPDLMLAVVFAWVLRRPDYVPAVLIALVVFVEDLIFMRPPGLWAVIVLAGSEFLRAREWRLRGLPFVVEWLFVALTAVAMLLAARLAMTVFMLPQVPLGLSLMQLISTLLVYPLIVAASRILVGLRRPDSAEVVAMGQRL